jgi:protein-disulfide isomerase
MHTRLSASRVCVFCGMVTVVMAALSPAVVAPHTQGVDARSTPPGDVAARVADLPITYGEIDAIALLEDAGEFRGSRLGDALYVARRRALEELVARRLLTIEAERRHVSVDDVLRENVHQRVAPVTASAIRSWRASNPALVPGGPQQQTDEEIRQRIVEDQTRELRSRYLKELRTHVSVVVFMTPPRDQVPTHADEPAIGPLAAPVQFVVYSDFQCPYCARLAPLVGRLREQYGDRLRIVFRDFPLSDIHPDAFNAAVAARCAHAQGRFWEYHDRLFAHQQELGPQFLLTHAASIGLDAGEMARCLQAPESAALVRHSAQSGEALAVAGTPTVFINGRRLTGSHGLRAFQETIEDELSIGATTADPAGPRHNEIKSTP